jgi:pantoate--beta-alanine ligase
MKVFNNPRDMQNQAQRWRRSSSGTVGFVPTMGALHEGHLELVRRSRKENKHTVVSIYVNPTQFGPKEDFNQYPRTLEADLKLLKREGVKAVFTPSDQDMYPEGFSVKMEITGPLVNGLCAPHRPGHFNGVVTVVVKLLNLVLPDRLYLGQKDAQQAAILKKTLQDLDTGVETVICPIVREPDGLAMSSRNQRLTPEGRKSAAVLYRALKVGKSIVDLGESDAEKVLVEIRKVVEAERNIKLQYLEAVDADNLQPVIEIKPGTLLALAAYLDNVRLIDNIVV